MLRHLTEVQIELLQNFFEFPIFANTYLSDSQENQIIHELENYLTFRAQNKEEKNRQKEVKTNPLRNQKD